jgi:hypothetical protein
MKKNRMIRSINKMYRREESAHDDGYEAFSRRAHGYPLSADMYVMMGNFFIGYRWNGIWYDG